MILIKTLYVLYQRGYGLGGMFGRFIKWIITRSKISAAIPTKDALLAQL